MNTTLRPISKRRLAELRGYVAWSTTFFRSAAFVAVVAGFAWMLRAVLARFDVGVVAAWLLPSLALAALLYALAGRWTGGRAFRAAVRKDLAGGVAAAHLVVALDAIQVEEGEDEGPGFFVLCDDGRTLLFAGQYLGPYRRKGFPWTRFEILEAPESKVFFGLVPQGEKLAPSARRPPFTWEEFKQFARGKREYSVINVDFAALKKQAIPDAMA